MIKSIANSPSFTSQVFVPLKNPLSPNIGSLVEYDSCKLSRFKSHIQNLEANDNDDRVTIFTKPSKKPHAMDDIMVVRVAEIGEDGRPYVGTAEKYGVLPYNIPLLYEKAKANMHPRPKSPLNEYIV